MCKLIILLSVSITFANAFGVNPNILNIITASSCSQADVKTAIDMANDGDVVEVPAGNCTWGSDLIITKGIYLRGAGASLLTIILQGSLTINKHATYNVELSGFTFIKNSSGNQNKMVYVNGAWLEKPPLIHDNVFTANNSGIFLYTTNGGVIYNNTFNGELNDAGFQHYVINDTESWTSPDSMGTNDANGDLNLYMEDNIFNNMSNQATDFGDASRIVFRYNTINSASFNSHGLATGPIGLRHFEIYNNSFNYPDDSISQNWFIWIRGGTGVIYNNHIDNIIGQMWGDKEEIGLSVRMADDGGIPGCATGYPAPHQVGQNHDGTNQFTDPIYLWNNTGNFVWGIRRFQDTCGLDINDYIQEGRDIVFSSTPKSGYTAYQYPHPLRNESLNITDETVDEAILYPNPTSGLINIDLPNVTDFEIIVYNNLWQIMKSVSNIKQIDISNFSDGLYYTIVKSQGRNIKSWKLIKHAKLKQ